MAKFRPKVESVDAVQVRFTDKGSWPKWLAGKVFVGDAREVAEGEVLPETPQRGDLIEVSDGDYLVRENGTVRVYTKTDFAGKFEPSRITKGKAAE